jgi:hypothetical protein
VAQVASRGPELVPREHVRRCGRRRARAHVRGGHAAVVDAEHVFDRLCVRVVRGRQRSAVFARRRMFAGGARPPLPSEGTLDGRAKPKRRPPPSLLSAQGHQHQAEGTHDRRSPRRGRARQSSERCAAGAVRSARPSENRTRTRRRALGARR